MGIRFSILTPTFNRAHTLPRAFEALVAQTKQPYEWIVVDDGSTDGTGSLVEGWAAKSPFPIRYFAQENSGKPSAHNAGLRMATGDLLAVLDSDSWCEPNALERFAQLWLEIPEAKRDQFTGITVNCADEKGRLVGLPFPHSPIDSTIADMWARRWCVGDKWGFHRLEVLRQFPFPLVVGEKFIPEGLVWNRVGRRYLMRFVNETLGRTEYSPGGLSDGHLRNLTGSPRGAFLFYAELAEHAPTLLTRAFALTNAIRFGLHAGERMVTEPRLRKFPALLPLCAVAGSFTWAIDSVRLRTDSMLSRPLKARIGLKQR